MEFITDWESFINDMTDDKIFNVSKYKKVFTPYEQSKQFVDELATEELGDYKIVSSITLPNSELLVGLSPVCEQIDIINGIETRKLLIGQTVEYHLLKDLMLIDVTKTEEYSGIGVGSVVDNE